MLKGVGAMDCTFSQASGAATYQPLTESVGVTFLRLMIEGVVPKLTKNTYSALEGTAVLSLQMLGISFS